MMSGLYDTALADVHADGYAGTYAAGFGWICDRIRQSGPQPRLFDVGCGDGTFLAHAARAGIPGAGADLSPAFVDRACARGLDVTCSRAATATIPPGTTAITALGEVLSYIDPPLGDAASLAAFLPRAAAHLPPGGLLLADLIGPDTPARSGETRGQGWAMTSTTTLDHDRAVLTRTMRVTNALGTHETVHRQAVLSPDAATGAARDAGFAATVYSSYGPAPLLPGRFLLEARLP